MEFNITYKHIITKRTFSQCNIHSKLSTSIHLPFLLCCLTLCSFKGQPWGKIWVQGVCLGGNCRKHSMTEVNRDSRKANKVCFYNSWLTTVGNGGSMCWGPSERRYRICLSLVPRVFFLISSPLSEGCFKTIKSQAACGLSMLQWPENAVSRDALGLRMPSGWA